MEIQMYQKYFRQWREQAHKQYYFEQNFKLFSNIFLKKFEETKNIF
jgi:hypothetical protein